jgi:hypothetical protein
MAQGSWVHSRLPALVHAGSILSEATAHLSVAILVSQCDRKEGLTLDTYR